MSASERPRPNQVKYQVRKEATTNSIARIRIGPDARTRCAAGVAAGVAIVTAGLFPLCSYFSTEDIVGADLCVRPGAHLRVRVGRTHRSAVHPTLFSRRRIEMIEHQVNDDTGYGNVQPERQRPTRYSAMPDEIAARGTIERDHDQRHDNHRQNCMTYQENEIKRPHPSLSGKTSSPVIKVIGEIGCEEQD